jgi:hypothetical protein
MASIGRRVTRRLTPLGSIASKVGKLKQIAEKLRVPWAMTTAQGSAIPCTGLPGLP